VDAADAELVEGRLRDLRAARDGVPQGEAITGLAPRFEPAGQSVSNSLIPILRATLNPPKRTGWSPATSEAISVALAAR